MGFGLASSPFARCYSGNHCCFLFLPVLRCFSSRRSRSGFDPGAMRGISPHEEVPFGNLGINVFMQLPPAYRRLSRPSSASQPSHPPAAVQRFVDLLTHPAMIFPGCAADAARNVQSTHRQGYKFQCTISILCSLGGNMVIGCTAASMVAVTDPPTRMTPFEVWSCWFRDPAHQIWDAWGVPTLMRI